jgi:hypothetical protein
MSPEEKAKELVEKYRGVAHSDFHNQTGYDEAQREENQKQCALIAVDEILKENERINLGGEFPTPLTNYWQEVKKEIEKL